MFPPRILFLSFNLCAVCIYGIDFVKCFVEGRKIFHENYYGIEKANRINPRMIDNVENCIVILKKKLRAALSPQNLHKQSITFNYSFLINIKQLFYLYLPLVCLLCFQHEYQI